MPSSALLLQQHQCLAKMLMVKRATDSMAPKSMDERAEGVVAMAADTGREDEMRVNLTILLAKRVVGGLAGLMAASKVISH